MNIINEAMIRAKKDLVKQEPKLSNKEFLQNLSQLDKFFLIEMLEERAAYWLGFLTPRVMGIVNSSLTGSTING